MIYPLPWEAMAEKLLRDKYCLIERARSCRNASKGKQLNPLTSERSNETPLGDRNRLLLRKWWRLLAQYVERDHKEEKETAANAADALCHLSPVQRVDNDIEMCKSRLEVHDIEERYADDSR